MEVVKYLEGETEILPPWCTKGGQNIFNTLWTASPGGMAAPSQPDAASAEHEESTRVSQGDGGRGRDGRSANTEPGPSEMPEGRERGWKSSSVTWQEGSGYAALGSRCGQSAALGSRPQQRRSRPRIPGLSAQLVPSPPPFPGTALVPTCLSLSLRREVSPLN